MMLRIRDCGLKARMPAAWDGVRQNYRVAFRHTLWICTSQSQVSHFNFDNFKLDLFVCVPVIVVLKYYVLMNLPMANSIKN